MKLSDLFSQLSVGELNNLSMSLDGSGDIDELAKPKIVHHANQVLTALYTRFPHKTDYVKVLLQEDLHKYYLRAEHAVSNTDQLNLAPRYIQDSVAEPFDPNLSKIIAIQDEDAECYRDVEVSINDLSKAVSVKKISFDGFWVKSPVAGNIYTVEYQCLHPKLTVDIPNDDEEIVLAPVLHEALTAGIAARVHAPIGSEDSTMKAAAYSNIYEGICLRAEADDTLQTSISNEHDKLREGGWE